jgi:Mg2+ and Co2+ transporter CorA
VQPKDGGVVTWKAWFLWILISISSVLTLADPNSMIPQTGNKMQTTDMIGAFADLGGTLGALGFCSWLVVYLLKLHDSEREQMRKSWGSERERVQAEREKERSEFTEERKLHLSKDSDNDEAMRQSMQRSQEQLLQIVESNQKQVSDLKEIMSSHSQDLKAIMLEMKLAIASGFDKVHERWDGNERRSSGNGKSSTSSRRASA